MTVVDSDEEFCVFGTAQTIFEVDLGSGESRSLLDGAEPFELEAGLARFVIVGEDCIGGYVSGLTLDSTVFLAVPSRALDSEDTVDVRLGFYLDAHLTIVMAGAGSISRDLLKEVAVRSIDELDEPLSERKMWRATFGGS